MSEKEELGLTEGWTYSVVTDKDHTSKGTFKGYAMLGTESAVVLQMAEGTTRIIPIASIVYIDVSGTCERKRSDDKRPESVYYG
jgi:hypothetical protein